MSVNGGAAGDAAKKRIETLKIVFAGPNASAAKTAMEVLHQLTPAHFRGELETVASGDDTLYHMEIYCYGLTETSFRNAVTVHLWGLASEQPSDTTMENLMRDSHGFAYFIGEDLDEAKSGLADMETVLQRVGKELKKTPILILPPPGDEPFEPMAEKLGRPVRNLFDSEPDTGYRLFLAVRILINRNLPEQPPRPAMFGGEYNYQHKPPESSLMSGDGEDISDLILPPEEKKSKKKSTFEFSDEEQPEKERRRGLFGRLMGGKKKEK